jgi:hypothetical protein
MRRGAKIFAPQSAQRRYPPQRKKARPVSRSGFGSLSKNLAAFRQ